MDELLPHGRVLVAVVDVRAELLVGIDLRDLFGDGVVEVDHAVGQDRLGGVVGQELAAVEGAAVGAFAEAAAVVGANREHGEVGTGLEEVKGGLDEDRDDLGV